MGKELEVIFMGLELNSLTSGVKNKRFLQKKEVLSLVLDETESLFDKLYSGQPAQYGTDEETPRYKWENVKTTLADLNTKKLHYILLPENHIVIDFDLKGPNGEKSLELNLEAANGFGLPHMPNLANLELAFIFIIFMMEMLNNLRGYILKGSK